MAEPCLCFQPNPTALGAGGADVQSPDASPRSGARDAHAAGYRRGANRRAAVARAARHDVKHAAPAPSHAGSLLLSLACACAGTEASELPVFRSVAESDE